MGTIFFARPACPTLASPEDPKQRMGRVELSHVRVRAPAHTESPGSPNSLSPESLRVRARLPCASVQQWPQGTLGLTCGEWWGLQSQHRVFESFQCVSGMGERIVCDIRDTEAKRENVFSGES